MGLNHGPPKFHQKLWILIRGTMVLNPIWVLVLAPYQMAMWWQRPNHFQAGSVDLLSGLSFAWERICGNVKPINPFSATLPFFGEWISICLLWLGAGILKNETFIVFSLLPLYIEFTLFFSFLLLDDVCTKLCSTLIKDQETHSKFFFKNWTCSEANDVLWC